jgi:5-methylcytosine-specific restriction endonuclease McrA
MRIRSTKPEFWRSDSRGHFIKAAIPGWVKREVVERAGAQPGHTTPAACFYCGSQGSIWWPLTYTGRVGSHMVTRGLEFDHVHPESLGGATTPENIVLACRPCNRGKGSKVVF